MLIEIDREKCILCGICEETLPDIFEIRNNTTTIKKPIVSEEDKLILRQLKEDCPAEALKITEESEDDKKIISFYIAGERR